MESTDYETERRTIIARIAAIKDGLGLDPRQKSDLSAYFAEHFTEMYESCGGDKDLQMGFLRCLTSYDNLRDWIDTELDHQNGVEFDTDANKEFKLAVLNSINYAKMFDLIIASIELPM